MYGENFYPPKGHLAMPEVQPSRPEAHPDKPEAQASWAWLDGPQVWMYKCIDGQLDGRKSPHSTGLG